MRFMNFLCVGFFSLQFKAGRSSATILSDPHLKMKLLYKTSNQWSFIHCYNSGKERKSHLRQPVPFMDSSKRPEGFHCKSLFASLQHPFN